MSSIKYKIIRGLKKGDRVYVKMYPYFEIIVDDVQYKDGLDILENMGANIIKQYIIDSRRFKWCVTNKFTKVEESKLKINIHK